MDHGSLEQELIVSTSLRRQCFNITIIDDDVAEEDEFFQVSLTSIRRIAGNNIYQVLITTATVTIIDDDCKSITFQFKSHNNIFIMVSHLRDLQSRVCEWTLQISWNLPVLRGMD